jgi:uracil-DNA glycosylase family 4
MAVKVPTFMPEVLPTRIAFVGEAPSVEEVIAKEPFVGPSGRIFNALLRNAGLDRDDYMITNVFDEMADNNDVTDFMHDEVRVQESFARLAEELAIAKPNVIVPLGATALWAFTGNKAIGNFRGAVTPATQIVPGAKLVPTMHPAVIIKQWHWLPIAVGDFVRADAEADLGPQMVYPKVEILIEPNIADIRRFVPEAQASPKLSIDIETGWGQITSIAFAPSTSKALAIPFVDLRRPNKSYWINAEQEFMAWKLVKEMCEAPNAKVGQNMLYDIFWLYDKKGIAVRNYRFDTRIRHKVMFPELPADLANMSASYTRVGSYKGWGGRYQKATEKKDG